MARKRTRKGQGDMQEKVDWRRLPTTLRPTWQAEGGGPRSHLHLWLGIEHGGVVILWQGPGGAGSESARLGGAGCTRQALGGVQRADQADAGCLRCEYIGLCCEYTAQEAASRSPERPSHPYSTRMACEYLQAFNEWIGRQLRPDGPACAMSDCA